MSDRPSSRAIILTAAEVAAAQSMGMPLAEYAVAMRDLRILREKRRQAALKGWRTRRLRKDKP